MNGRRNVTRDIWRAVVMAGAMLGTTACGSSTKPDTTPPKNEAAPAPAEPAPAPEPATKPADDSKPAPQADNPCAAKTGDQKTENPCADNPCARPRGTDDGPRGRGFILA